MNKNSSRLIALFTVMSTALLLELLFLSLTDTMSSSILKDKQKFVHITALPDLALASSTSYIRHRSLSGVSEVYSYDGSLREFEKESYTFAK